ncbi:MAG: DMT family transporter [Chlamydiales bacterium]
MFVKFALEGFTPFAIVWIRLTLGCLLLLPIIWFRKRKLLEWKHYWKHFFIMGLFANAIPFSLISYSEIYISSSLAAIINGSAPIFVTILAHFVIHDEKMSWMKTVGIGLGFAGLILVMLPSLLEARYGSTFGVFLMIGAAMCYAIGMVYGRRHLSRVPGLIAPTWQLFFASITMLPFVLIFSPMPINPPAISIFGLIGLAVIGTSTAFYFYYQLVQKAGATYLSLSTLLFPIISINLGVIFLNEKLSTMAYFGFALILAGLVTIITKKTIPTK